MCSVHTVQDVNNLSPLYLYLISGMKPNLPTVVNHEGGHENKFSVAFKSYPINCWSFMLFKGAEQCTLWCSWPGAGG